MTAAEGFDAALLARFVIKGKQQLAILVPKRRPRPLHVVIRGGQGNRIAYQGGAR